MLHFVMIMYVLQTWPIKKGLIFIILKILCNVRFRIDRKTQKYTRSENKGGEAIENSKL